MAFTVQHITHSQRRYLIFHASYMMVMCATSVTIEQFLGACEAWDLDKVHQAVESGFCVDTFDDDHVTGLQMAAATGNIGIVQYLLDRGADIEKSNQVGMTALHHAARNGHVNIVRALVQRGANFQKLTYLGASAMTLAAGNGHTEVIKLLLNLKVNVNPSHTALCPTPVIAAAFRRHTHVCAMLSHRGAYLDGNIQRLANLSALSVAISCGSTAVVGALLELGASASFRSLNGMTALELAQHLQRDDLLVVMHSAMRSGLKEESAEMDLRKLIRNKDGSAIGRILSRRMPYAPFPEDTTPLMYAVLLTDISIVKAIQQSSDVDINATESVSGLTALMLAVIVGDHEIVEYLVNAGANISLMSVDGFTAIDYAFAMGNLNANLLCYLQQCLECGIMQSQPQGDNHQYHFISCGTHKGRGRGVKILNKLSNHIGLGGAANSAGFRERLTFNRNHLNKLLGIHLHDDEEFVLANDILISIGNEKNENKDDLHCYIKVARYIAENCAKHGILNLPVIFTFDNDDLGECKLTKYAPSLNNSTSMRTVTNRRNRYFLSIAQKNAYLYYDCRFPNPICRGQSLNTRRTQHLCNDNDSRKISSSTSASEHSSSVRSCFYSSFERSSTHTLRTTPRFRSRSRETIKLNIGDDMDDDNGRNSPSRSSLNQYAFAIKNEEHLIKNSTTPISSVLNRQQSPFNNTNHLDCEKQISNDNLSAVQAVIYDKTYQQRRPKITDDLIWQKLHEAGLGKYVSLLKNEEVDKGIFLTLTRDDFADIGITDTCHQTTLLNIAKTLRLLSSYNIENIELLNK